MNIVSGLDFQLNNDTAITIGKFDGIHRGHRELLDRIIAKKKEGLAPTVFTFDKSPSEVFSGIMMPSLTTMEEKIRIFQHLGIENLVIYPLDKKTAAIDPLDYINNILCKQMRMKYIAAGTDLSFGHMGKGDAKLIMDMSNGRYETEIVDKILIGGEEVSSTFIRELVSSGDMRKAREFIGVPYAVSGVVKHGRALGRTMGFPTVNLQISEEKLMPPYGVYFAEVSIDGRHYNGITNIGCKPTVTESKTVFAETNILDFDEDVYGKMITVKLLKYQRPEQKFSSIDELKRKISMDIQTGKEFFDEKACIL